ncbi:MAG: ribonuclease III [Burkholderiales bacterium]|nr:ribonuclease III [Burkholderiales bacterium]
MAATLRDHLRYSFHRPELLRQALTHRSFGAAHNERLEFVGDAVLNCAIGLALFRRHPMLAEGDLSRVRAALVNQETLARVARRLGLGSQISLGEGEQKSGGGERPSILADALEAVFGAVFIDAGFDQAFEVIVACYGDVLENADPAALGKDPKTRLQEWLQARKLPVPEYVVTAVTGEAHAQTFEVECRIASLGRSATGRGSSRRAAEQAAAEAAGVDVVQHDQRAPRAGA